MTVEGGAGGRAELCKLLKRSGVLVCLIVSGAWTEKANSLWERGSENSKRIAGAWARTPVAAPKSMLRQAALSAHALMQSARLQVGWHAGAGDRSNPRMAIFFATVPSRRLTATLTVRAGNRRFARLSALRALRAPPKAPYKTDLLWETLRALNRPERARTVDDRAARGDAVDRDVHGADPQRRRARRGDLSRDAGTRHY